MKKTLFVLLAASAICLAATSCQKEGSARVPKVPSVETIKIDLSAIPATKADESQTFSGITDILTDIWGKIYDQIINISVDATIEWNSRTGACRFKIGSSNWIEI